MIHFNSFSKSLALLITFISVFNITSNACSFFKYHANGNTYIGRTMEAPMEMDEELVIVPQNYDLHGITTTYGFVGIKHGDTEWISSGMNEHGVNVEVLALGESQYAPKGTGDINHLEVASYVLAKAKTVDEAIELLSKIKVDVTPISVSHDMEIGMHYAITDAKRSVVIEYLNGKGTPEVYENNLGVLTNDPNYVDQELMAQALINGSTLENGLTKFPDELFTRFNKSPHERFQQLVAYNFTQDLSRVKTDFDGVNRAWAMVNALEIVQGTLYWKFVDPKPQMVGYSIVVDVNNKAYHFRTYDNMDIRKVDINDINFATVKYQTQDIYRNKNTYSNVEIN